VVTHVYVNKTILLFLPEGEYHELGLLYICYLLKNRGARVLYLGANVPMKDVEFICKQKRPDYLYTHITCMTGSFSFDKFVAQKNQSVKDLPLIISGQLAQSQVRKAPPSVHFKRSLSEVLEYVAGL
jgi:hypothetical protein